MPSYLSLLSETMMFAITSKPEPKRITPSAGLSVENLPPDNVDLLTGPFPALSAVAKVGVWSWKWKASVPAELTNLTCRTRSMNMQYKMAMPVCDRLAVENLIVVTPSARVAVPLTEKFITDEFIASGHIPPSNTGLWQLEAEVDESLLVTFAYHLKGGNLEPIPRDQIDKIGSKFMPSLADQSPAATVDEATMVFTSSLRLLVCIGFTLCKENPDFAPNEPVGMFRVYPHVMVVASGPLLSVEADIVIHRPERTQHHGPMNNNDYFDTGGVPDPILPIDTMGSKLVHELMTDRNDATVSISLPTWDKIFDYYETDPIKNDVGFGRPVVMSDPSKPKSRSDPGAVVKRLSRLALAGLPGELPGGATTGSQSDLGKPSYLREPIEKVPFQGEFDNLHIAPRMAMVPSLDASASNIAMAPFCVHDCLHMHVRWGNVALVSKPQRGFNDAGVPYQDKGAPHVPRNQRVTWQLLKPAGVRYRFVADGPIVPGTWTVGCHHGLAYAGELWSTALVAAARNGVETFSSGERKFGARTAANSWAMFYWRLRYGGTPDEIMERLVVPNLDAVRAL